MQIDLIDLATSEAFIGTCESKDAPDFGVPFEYEGRQVKRVPSVLQPLIAKNYGTRALSRPRWHPAFERHDKRGYGLVSDKRELQRVLDRQKARAKSENDVWTWDQQD